MGSAAAGSYSVPTPANLPLPVVAAVNPVNQTQTQDLVPGELIVKFKPQPGLAAASDIAATIGAGEVRPVLLPDYAVVSVPAGQDLGQAADALRRNPAVVSVEQNAYAHAFFTPNDPLYSYQWNFPKIQMSQAWNLSNGSGITVAVVDTGVAYENYGGFLRAPDLANTNFITGYNFVNNTAHANDDNQHGTHVAGTIAQSTNNSTGVAGIAYNATIMPVKVLDSTGYGTYVTVTNGIKWAADNGAKVINLSLGGSSPSGILEDAINYAYNKGVVVVAAAGNENGSILYPAVYSNTIAVGAIRPDEARAYYSNYGPEIDLVAPGGETISNPGDGVYQQTFALRNPTAFGYYFFQGTSMATPHVAAVAALLLSYGYVTTPDQVRQVLQTTAKDLGTPGWDQYFGYGMIQAYDALVYSSGGTPQPIATATNTATATTTVPASTPTITANATSTATDTPTPFLAYMPAVMKDYEGGW